VISKAKRTDRILLRVTPAEKALIRERAGGARQMSDFIRRLALGGADSAVAERRAQDRRAEKAEARAPGDFAALVDRYEKTMPRRSAKIVAKRELARE
jgi:uncharacterized protein (DUF1778 family)